MPRPEIIFWSKIRARQLGGLKFRRQFSIDRYVLDFYCPELRLAIELDGNSHFTKSAKIDDSIRDQYLQSKNIMVLRFTNNEIRENLTGVLDKLIKESESRKKFFFTTSTNSS